LLVRRRIEEAIHLLKGQEWIVQLLVRVFVGYFFMETGWGKLHNLDGFAQRFAGWGIPWPHFNAGIKKEKITNNLTTINKRGQKMLQEKNK